LSLRLWRLVRRGSSANFARVSIVGALAVVLGVGALVPVSGAGAAPALQAAGCPAAGSATALTGAGATFPAPIYTRWFDSYAQGCGVQVNYQAIGSGGGIRQHTERTVDFGASDAILTPEQFAAAPGTIMIPTVAGAVALVANIEGITAGQLQASGDTIAKIYLGEITRWNDPRLQAENPNMNLSDRAITPVRRSDGSGTTNIFTTYLSKISPDWQSRVGASTSVEWPAGVGGEGNAGVAGQVRQIPGAIGYVELAYAKQNNLPWLAIRNQANNYIQPTLDSTTVAMEGLDLPDNMQVMLVDSPNPQAYPIAGFTWVLVYQNQTDRAKAQTLVSLLRWSLTDAQSMASALDYAQLSPAAQQKALALVNSITAGGQPLP
jgi:phosphate transport system substrate-binding protein